MNSHLKAFFLAESLDRANELGVKTTPKNKEFDKDSVQSASSSSTAVLIGIVFGAVVAAAGVE